MAPIVEALAEKYEGKAIIGKYNVDDNEDLAPEYNIRNIPVLLFLKNGEVKHKFVGITSQADIEAKIEELLWPSQSLQRKLLPSGSSQLKVDNLQWEDGRGSSFHIP